MTDTASTPDNRNSPPPSPVVTSGGSSAFFQLVRSRFLEFCREPEAIFWVYGFPVLMVLSLGIAYREKPVERLRVDVVAGPSAAADSELLAAEGTGLRAGVADRPAALERLRTGRSDLAIEREAAPPSATPPPVGGPPAGGMRYHFDATRPESVLARDRARDTLERAAGRRDVLVAHDQPLDAPGGRYIDFLVPGLMALSLMGGGLWGVGFVAVELRIRKLLKRFIATPMRRWQFLLSIMVSRMLFMIPEMVLLVLFSRWAFGVRIFGSPLALAVLVLFGATCFSGIGLLVAARAKTMEAVSGALNLIMLPMWLGSGAFFSRERYPEALQPLLRAMPLTPLVDALRGVMLEGRTLGGCREEIAILGAWGLVSFAVALRIFRWQ